MRITIDTDTGVLELDDGGTPRPVDLYSQEAFECISDLWIRTGWARRYSYGFSWMGRPIIQLPEDLIRMQEVLFEVRPTVVVETGIAHGGSVVFHASLLQAMGGGRVVAVDIEIRPHNRAALTQHPAARDITLIEGSSIDPAVVEQVKACIRPDDRVLVVLDSDHRRDHVRAELEAYGPLVSEGSYLIATDGVMRDLAEAPGGQPDWTWNNPAEAAEQFARANPEFERVEPNRPFDESETPNRVTYWPSAFLRRRRTG